MKQIVKDYLTLTQPKTIDSTPAGVSASPKNMIFYILDKNSESTDVLDIGFGIGELGHIIKSNQETKHWNIDGIDAWEANCLNENLIKKNIYRNIWHGYAQELPSEVISKYRIICLLDVIEHLTAETARWLLRTLLTNMGQHSYLFISTPLWFYPQNHQQEGDLEEHLIGVPASSMMALIPKIYSIGDRLVGGFVYGKGSLNYIDLFQPITDKNFSLEMGLNIINSINLPAEQGIIYKNNVEV
jgi:2-polyprenyl-3-methyl-5-hydroxy-6-metoxy-1,4-benzoquinol methylase